MGTSPGMLMYVHDIEDYLNEIGTTFSLNDEEVDRLISAARQVLRESPELKAFIDHSRELH